MVVSAGKLVPGVADDVKLAIPDSSSVAMGSFHVTGRELVPGFTVTTMSAGHLSTVGGVISAKFFTGMK